MAADHTAIAVAEETCVAEVAKAVWGPLGLCDTKNVRWGEDAGYMRGTGCLCSEGDEKSEEEVGGDGLERLVELLWIIGFGAVVPDAGEWEDCC